MGRLYDNCQERNRCLVPPGNTTDLRIDDTEESVESMVKELNHTVELFTHRVKYLVEKLKNSTVGLIG